MPSVRVAILIAGLLLAACATIPPTPPPPRLCSLDSATVKFRFNGWTQIYNLTVTTSDDQHYLVIALIAPQPMLVVVFVTHDQQILACRLFRSDGVLLEELGPGLPSTSGATASD